MPFVFAIVNCLAISSLTDCVCRPGVSAGADMAGVVEVSAVAVGAAAPCWQPGTGVSRPSKWVRLFDFSWNGINERSVCVVVCECVWVTERRNPQSVDPISDIFIIKLNTQLCQPNRHSWVRTHTHIYIYVYLCMCIDNIKINNN